MKRLPFSHGVVSLAALDLRRRPDHRGELGSQLLIGEVVRILEASRDGLWWRVRNLADGYEGWVRTWGLVGASARRAARWARLARARVLRICVEAHATPAGGALTSPLFWNGRVIAGRRSGRRVAVELPDGRRGWVDSGSIATRPVKIPLAERVKSLLGVPYLWGGRTPLGFDCSSFTQQVLAEQGCALPRDAQQQFAACRPLASRAEAREGDLIFFGRPRGPVGHVGLALGGGYYAHARRSVHIGSLDDGNPLYESDLGAQLRGFGRPRKQA